MVEQLEGRELKSVLCQLVGAMREDKSWAGHTQIQKSCLFLQKMLGVPLGYGFELYLHGPYSFELKDDLEDMLSAEELGLEPRPGYGPSFFVTERGRKHINPDKQYGTQIDFIAQKVATKTVRNLERIATAYFLITQDNGLSEGRIPEEINRLKPHISVDDARSALKEVKELEALAKESLKASAD